MPASAELFTVLTPAGAWAAFSAHFSPRVTAERAATEDALGRVLAEDVFAAEDLPDFERSVVDGYAVIAQDTHGASPGLPALLTVVGEAPMGQAATVAVGFGEAVLTHTGGMLAPGADAVVMVEHTAALPGGAHIEVMRPVAAGENVLHAGEDVRRGQRLYARGHRLRPQDIGGLMALGIVEIGLARRPVVGILSTGDEVVPPSRAPGVGQVRDVNAYALSALVAEAGGAPQRYGIVADQRDLLEQAARAAAAECDAVVITAGSSVSYRDMSVDVINSLGAPGVLVHGVSVKPGKPTILAVCGGVPVFGLPGNPVSALVIAQLFVAPAVRAMLGAPEPRRASVRARLARNVASATGREDYVPVRLEERAGELWASPVLGKSNLIYTLVNADGTVRIELNSNGVRQGEWVTVEF